MSPAERSAGKKETKPGEAKTNLQTNPGRANPVEPDGGGRSPGVEWCAERAAHALRWLAMHYPECSGSEALHGPQDAAHAAAVAGDEEAFLEALREYMRRGRAVALGIRREAA